MAGIIESFRQGARNALAAGFDGVELHGANGYLLQQFLETHSNRRTDQYGGSVGNRARLLLEVVTAVAKVWGPDRVGVRLSPFGTFNDSGERDPLPLYTYVLRSLAAFDLAYVHLIEAREEERHLPARPGPGSLWVDSLRTSWPGPLIAAGGFEGPSADAAIRSGQADAVAFGRFFIANPDLPRRLRIDAPLNPYDRTTFYGGGAKGYIDYPALDERAGQAAAPFRAGSAAA